jgi:hypothetical protein
MFTLLKGKLHVLIDDLLENNKNKDMEKKLRVLLFCGRWSPLFYSFLIMKTVGRTPWAADQPVARALPTKDNTNTE